VLKNRKALRKSSDDVGAMSTAPQPPPKLDWPSAPVAEPAPGLVHKQRVRRSQPAERARASDDADPYFAATVRKAMKARGFDAANGSPTLDLATADLDEFAAAWDHLVEERLRQAPVSRKARAKPQRRLERAQSESPRTPRISRQAQPLPQSKEAAPLPPSPPPPPPPMSPEQIEQLLQYQHEANLQRQYQQQQRQWQGLQQEWQHRQQCEQSGQQQQQHQHEPQQRSRSFTNNRFSRLASSLSFVSLAGKQARVAPGAEGSSGQPQHFGSSPQKHGQSRPNNLSSRLFRFGRLGVWPAGAARAAPDAVPAEPPDDPKSRACGLIQEMEEMLLETRDQPLVQRQRIFRDLQRRLHPDKNATCAEAAKLAFQELMDRKRVYLRS